MTINIISSHRYLEEKKYIIHVLVEDFLGIKCNICFNDEIQYKSLYLLECQGASKKIIIKDIFFQTSPDNWLDEKSLPDLPLEDWLFPSELKNSLPSNGVPVLYGDKLHNGSFFKMQPDSIQLGIDIFGAAFFMLSRYEEVVNPIGDAHGRFPAKASLAYREGFLDRPIINEYIEILWWCMKRLWPGLEKKPRKFRMIPTHDVDHPYVVNGLPFHKMARSCAGDLIRRKNPYLSFQRFQSWLKTNKLGADHDLANTFDYIMDKSEEVGLQSAFYFKGGFTNINYDYNYSLDDPWIRKLIRRIHSREHEIGIHPSYETYADPKKTLEEYFCLKKVVEEEQIEQKQWGGRQHYLRWEVPATWRNWEEAGLDYDSTLGYADYPGFRCGVCYEFPVFDLQERRPINLWERPLIVMESSLLNENYLWLTHDGAWKMIVPLIEACKRYNGDFVFLWHNSYLLRTDDQLVYERILSEAK